MVRAISLEVNEGPSDEVNVAERQDKPFRACPTLDEKKNKLTALTTISESPNPFSSLPPNIDILLGRPKQP